MNPKKKWISQLGLDNVHVSRDYRTFIRTKVSEFAVEVTFKVVHGSPDVKRNFLSSEPNTHLPAKLQPFRNARLKFGLG